MAKPDATKPTKDTPVSPQDAIDHLRGIEKQVKGHLGQLPDHNPDSFGVGAVRPIRNQGLVIANTSLQVGGQRLGVNVRGPEDAAKQKTSPTLITVNDGGKETVFEPRRNDKGEVSFVNKETVGQRGRENGILKPQTLEDFVVDKVAQTPNKEFTNQATVKPVKQDLGLADGAPRIAAPATGEAKPPHRLDRAASWTVEDGDATKKRLDAAPSTGAGRPVITAGSDVGLAAIKAPDFTIEKAADAGVRSDGTRLAARAADQRADAERGAKADAILAAGHGGLKIEHPVDAGQRVRDTNAGAASAGGTDKAGAGAGKGQTGWRAGTTKLRVPGAPGSSGI